MEHTIAFFGAGNMAEALIAGIIRRNLIKKEHILVTNRSNNETLEKISEKYNVQCFLDKRSMLKTSNIIILAMKPKDADEYLEWLKKYVEPHHLIISVIAGLPVTHIEKKLGRHNPVIRTMPNTSALIGESATAISRGSYVNDNELNIAQEIFQTLGLVKIAKEEDMHTISAISGAGPAFYYYMVESMEKAATEFGLDQETAREMLAQTVIGAGKMLEDSGETPEQLRLNITSPSGITEAGLQQLMEKNFEEMIKACITRTRARSIEISEDI